MYDFDDDYYEPGEFDEKIEELKDAIRDRLRLNSLRSNLLMLKGSRRTQ